MAAINIKIDDNLKDTGDAILRELGLNATQYITLCWQYLAQHRKLPFMTETKILTASDLTMTIATQFRDVLNQLHKIRDMLNSEGTDFLNCLLQNRLSPVCLQTYNRTAGDWSPCLKILMHPPRPVGCCPELTIT